MVQKKQHYTPEVISKIFARVHNVDMNCKNGRKLLHSISRLTEMPLGSIQLLKLRDNNVPR